MQMTVWKGLRDGTGSCALQLGAGSRKGHAEEQGSINRELGGVC